MATPELIGAVKAALDNQMQRAVNISLGSVLATIGLTIPSVLVINHLIERPTVLGLEHTDLPLLILTLGVSMITFTSGRTNMLQGVVHLLLFAAYILLDFSGLSVARATFTSLAPEISEYNRSGISPHKR